jgi:glycosyltransferase involved in cell wall biosynthesis
MLLSNDFVADPRVEKEAAALSDAGHQVTVLAWNRSGIAAPAGTDGRFLVERLGPPASHGGGVRNLGAYRRFWREAAMRSEQLTPTVIHCHDADTIPAGRQAKRRLEAAGRPVHLVVDFHELYRDSKMVPQRGLLGRLARFAAQHVERTGVRDASLVIVANPGTATYYARLGGRGDVVVVENAPELGRFRVRETRSDSREFTVCYIGQKRYVESLETLMRAVQGLEGVRAYLGGGGVDAEEIERKARDYDRVLTEGRLSYAEIPSRYDGCDAVYAVNDVRVGNMRVNFPVKAMEGMALGIPVIVNSGTWVGDFVTEHGVGLAVRGDSVSAVADAIATLRDDPELVRAMGRRGRVIVEDGLNWSSAAQRLVAAYGSLD